MLFYCGFTSFLYCVYIIIQKIGPKTKLLTGTEKVATERGGKYPRRQIKIPKIWITAAKYIQRRYVGSFLENHFRTVVTLLFINLRFFRYRLNSGSLALRANNLEFVKMICPFFPGHS